MVRQRSAKPLFAGSIPAPASKSRSGFLVNGGFASHTGSIDSLTPVRSPLKGLRPCRSAPAGSIPAPASKSRSGFLVKGGFASRAGSPANHANGRESDCGGSRAGCGFHTPSYFDVERWKLSACHAEALRRRRRGALQVPVRPANEFAEAAGRFSASLRAWRDLREKSKCRRPGGQCGGESANAGRREHWRQTQRRRGGRSRLPQTS